MDEMEVNAGISNGTHKEVGKNLRDDHQPTELCSSPHQDLGFIHVDGDNEAMEELSEALSYDEDVGVDVDASALVEAIQPREVVLVHEPLDPVPCSTASDEVEDVQANSLSNSDESGLSHDIDFHVVHGNVPYIWNCHLLPLPRATTYLTLREVNGAILNVSLHSSRYIDTVKNS